MAGSAPFTIDIENDHDFGLMIYLGFSNGSPTDAQIREIGQAFLGCSFITEMFPNGAPRTFDLFVDTTRPISLT